MKSTLLFLVLFAGLTVSAADGLYAIVKGTNVLAVWQFDANRPPRALTNAPFAGATNVPITELEHSTIQKGWTYSGGVFRNPDGKPIANGFKTRIDREKLLTAAILELDDMQVQAASALANWATMTAGQKDNSAKRVIQAMKTVSNILELLLREQRSLLEIKPAE